MNLPIITRLSSFFLLNGIINITFLLRDCKSDNYKIHLTNSTGKFDCIQCIHGVNEPIENFTLTCTYYHSWRFPFNFTAVIIIRQHT